MKATAGLPFLLEEDDVVSFVPPQLDAPRSGRVVHVELIDETQAEVTFDGIDARDVAMKLVGCHCLIPRDAIDPTVFEEAPGMWDGWTVEDECAGTIGQVSGLIENPGQSLLQVETPDGREVLIPVVDEIVVAVDVDSSIVHVALPSGLLEL